ncbi:hypothetical protein COOONC_00176, partial [Cooperia oncophora]
YRDQKVVPSDPATPSSKEASTLKKTSSFCPPPTAYRHDGAHSPFLSVLPASSPSIHVHASSVDQQVRETPKPTHDLGSPTYRGDLLANQLSIDLIVNSTDMALNCSSGPKSKMIGFFCLS